MRVFAVTPICVSEVELARRQARYDALSPSELTVELHNLGAGAPKALDSPAEIEDSTGLVREALAGAPDNADAMLPDCVLDPAVMDLAGKLDRPVFGILRSALAWSRLAGRRVGAVTRNDAIAEELALQVDRYGYSDTFSGVQVLDLDVDAIHDSGRWGQALRRIATDLGGAGAAELLNGCSAVDLPADVKTWPVRVVDPIARALRVIAAGEA